MRSLRAAPGRYWARWGDHPESHRNVPLLRYRPETNTTSYICVWRGAPILSPDSDKTGEGARRVALGAEQVARSQSTRAESDHPGPSLRPRGPRPGFSRQRVRLCAGPGPLGVWNQSTRRPLACPSLPPIASLSATCRWGAGLHPGPLAQSKSLFFTDGAKGGSTQDQGRKAGTGSLGGQGPGAGLGATLAGLHRVQRPQGHRALRRSL